MVKSIYKPIVNDNNSYSAFFGCVMKLANLNPDLRCRVLSAADDYEELQSRFFALGLFPGVEVKVLRSAPLGDPLQIRVGSSLLSIRKREAQWIEVEQLPS